MTTATKSTKGDMARVLLVVGAAESELADALDADDLTVVPASSDEDWPPLACWVDVVVLDCQYALQMSDAARCRLRATGVPVLGLTSGLPEACETCGWTCDDLLLWPFTVEELRLRLRRLLAKTRRAHLRAGDLRLDPTSGRAWRAGRELGLTRLEFALLAYLVRCQGRPVSCDELLTAVWGCDWEEGSRAMVKEAVRRLRRKVEEDPSQPKLIVTVWGRGYRLEGPE